MGGHLLASSRWGEEEEYVLGGEGEGALRERERPLGRGDVIPLLDYSVWYILRIAGELLSEAAFSYIFALHHLAI